MKTIKLILSMCFITILLFSCKKNEHKEVLEKNHSEKIEKKDPPRTGEDLNRDVYFNINIKDNINYQPMHVEMNAKRGFVILGKFDKTKKHKKDSINFYVYSSFPKDSLSIKSVTYLDTINKIIHIRVDLDTDRTVANNPIPLVLDLVKLKKKDVIDLELYLNGSKYPSKKSENYEGKFNVGDHICKSLVVDPNL